jgi:uncharacterized protein YdeI (YjbR/CyaY-like superfamily)
VPDTLEELVLADARDWRRWLADHHPDTEGVWLALHKKGGTVTELTYQQALEEALCFGWIDGQIRRRDIGSYWQRFTPRRPRSSWSRRNVELVTRLSDDGRMMPAGSAAVEAARADGRIDRAYAGAAAAEFPQDLSAAIASDPKAQAMWDILTSANRYAITYRVQQARRPDTRARRVEQFVAMLARGETMHPQRRHV